jgi:hypothetical protein
MTPEYPDRDPDLFYEMARDRHAAQADALGSLDTKLAFFLSSSSALLSILIAVYALRPGAFHTLELVLVGVSGGVWLVLTVRALYAFRHRPWKSGPRLQEFYDLYFVRDERRLKWIAANRFWGDYNDNKPLEDRKASALTWALCLFVTQTLLLIATLVLVAVFPSSGSSCRSRPLDRAALGGQAPAPAPAQAEQEFRRVSVPPLRSSIQDLTP